MIGYLKFKDVYFEYEDTESIIKIQLEYFLVNLIWLKVRFAFRNLKVEYVIKTPNRLKSLKKKVNNRKKLENEEDDNDEEDESPLLEKENNLFKEQFLSKLLKKHQRTNEIFSDEIIEDVMKPSILSTKEMLLRNLLVFFDLVVEKCEIDFRINENDYFHNIVIQKILIGAMKSTNKNKEMHFIIKVFGINLNEYRLKENKEDYIVLTLFWIKQVFINLKFEFGTEEISFNNSINVKISINRIKSEISTSAITNIINLIVQINNINSLKSKDLHLNKKETTDIVEKSLSKILDSSLKTFKLEILNADIRVLSDNHIFQFFSITSSQILYNKKQLFNYFYDKTRIKLIKGTSELKIQELIFYSVTNKIMLALPSFTFSNSSDLSFMHESRTACSTSFFNSEIASLEILISTKELDKILEIVLNIIEGIDKISDSNKKISYNQGIINDSDIVNIKINNTKAKLYEDNFELILNPLYLNIRVDDQKSMNKKVDINFGPIDVDIFNTNPNDNESFGQVNIKSKIMVKGFRILVEDLPSGNNHTKLSFEETFILLYDYHLLDVIKFISNFIAYILKDSIKSSRKRKSEFPNHKKIKLKNYVELLFIKVRVEYVIDYEDIFILKFKDFKFLIDEEMNVPLIRIKHSAPNKVVLRKKTNLLELQNFTITFKQNDIKILMSKIDLNFYCFELVYPISKISYYYQFFPIWIDYHFFHKYMIDDDCKELFVEEAAYKNKVQIQFDNVKVRINEYEVGSAAILQAKKSEIEVHEASNSVVKYLKHIKGDQLCVIVNNFTINIDGFCEKICQYYNNNVYYYKNINDRGKVFLKFQEIFIFHENRKLIDLKDFKIDIATHYFFDNYNIENLESNVVIFKNHSLFYKKVKCDKNKDSNVQLNIENMKVSLDDIKIFDKITGLTFKSLETIFAFKFKEYEPQFLSDEENCIYSHKLNLNVMSLAILVNSIDPVSNKIFKQLNFFVDYFSLSTVNSNEESMLEISVYLLKFGFFKSNNSIQDNFDYPLITIPLAEMRMDNKEHTIKVNVQPNCLHKKHVIYNPLSTPMKRQFSMNELDRLILNTDSFTLFLNFEYLFTFYKIFENFLERSQYLKFYLFPSKKEGPFEREAKMKTKTFFNSNSIFSEGFNKEYEDDIQTIRERKPKFKLLCNVLDIKIIYLVKYKKEYSETFKFHPDIRINGYFGYIVRLYSASLRYTMTDDKLDDLKVTTNLFTVSFLQPGNFDDSKYFKRDKEIKISRFLNLKRLQNFNEFMELSKNNKICLVNINFSNLFDYQKSFGYEKEEYEDLIFDSKETIIKIFEITFKRESFFQANLENINIIVNDMKVTWNKFNKDVVDKLVFDDVLMIVDKVILKLDKKTEKEEDKISILDFGKFTFVFELSNPQICIQNELKNSKLLLTTKKNCKIVISKLCMNETKKDFKMDVLVNMMTLYVAPNFMDSQKIYWIGDSEENKYYLEENLFNSMLETPEIIFNITQTLATNEETKFDSQTSVVIQVDTIKADFENAYFNHFLNITDVFIFDRGYSYAEEKNQQDSRELDMLQMKLDEIHFRLKEYQGNTSKALTKILQKHVEFSLNNVNLTLKKGGKEIIQFTMTNFHGEMDIYIDKSSDSMLSVKDIIILDKHYSNNTVILSPYKEKLINNEFEDKLSLLRLKRRDSYRPTGTESTWYTLDYFELSLLPLVINLSKAHTDFIIEFFFSQEVSADDEEEMKNLLMHNSKYANKKPIKKDDQSDKKEIQIASAVITQAQDKKTSIDEKKIDYPILYKNFKIEETELSVSYTHAENSYLNLKGAKIKFNAFTKNDKFYNKNILLERFITHLKFMCFQNLPNILSSLISSGTGKNPKNDNLTKEELRKILLGSR